MRSNKDDFKFIEKRKKAEGGGLEDFQFGCMRSIAHNIGEEIQWVAQQRFLPKINMWFNREKLNQYHPKQPTKLIMNGWYINKPEKFLNKSKNLVPLLISMYIHRSCYKYFARKDIKDFLIKNAPIGCRDMSTVKYLETIGVPSYFSACLTLTLERNPNIKKRDYILALGLTQAQEEYLKSHTTHVVYSFDRLIPAIYPTKTRFEIAKTILALYQSAHCIVTNKMHAALPSLALQTPVLLIDIDKNDLKNDPERFDGVYDFLHHTTPKDFVEGNFNYDFDNPPENPDKYLEYRENLIKKCSEFTGFNNENTLIPEQEPIEMILRYFTMPKYYSRHYKRVCYWIPNIELFKALFNKVILRKDYFGIK